MQDIARLLEGAEFLRKGARSAWPRKDLLAQLVAALTSQLEDIPTLSLAKVSEVPHESFWA